MLIDEVEIIIKAGHGGAGKVSFGPARFAGPDGGNGGRGGDVYLEATTDLYALNIFTKRKLVEGKDGKPGGTARKFGENGQSLTVKLPVGTELIDLETGEKFNLESSGQKILIAEGGLGGRGNFEFRSPTNTTPRYAQPGLSGQTRKLKVHLKLIADFGFIGLPNAGKSSLLNELTAANVKVGDYQFTTLEPNLGVIFLPRHPGVATTTIGSKRSEDSTSAEQKQALLIDHPGLQNDNRKGQKIIADIPGLIEGASTGKGLGIKFLKHIEKVGMLLHCISAESENPKKDYATIRKELGEFDGKLLEKPEIILLTKSDLVSESDLRSKINDLGKLNPEVIPVSIHDFDSLEKLKVTILNNFN